MNDLKLLLFTKDYQEEISSKLDLINYYKIIKFDDYNTLMKQIKELDFDLALIEISFEETSEGIEAAFYVQEFKEKPVLFLCAEEPNETLLKRALIREDFESLSPPFKLEELHANIKLCIQKHKTEKELSKQKQLLNVTLSNIGSGVIILDTKGTIFYLNDMAKALTGFSEKEDLGKHIDDIFITNKEVNEELVNFGIHKNSFETETIAILNNAILKNPKTKKEIPININTAPLKDEKNKILGAVIVFKNISEQKRIEKQLKNSLLEKELLLKEIHHRVKNSLQLVSGLLTIQSSEITDKLALTALKKSQDRIKSIALVHEKLYQSKNYKDIDIKKYLEDLVEYLEESFDFKSRNIKLKTEIKSFLLPAKTVINCGLIVNELLLNSLKHAFKKTQKNKKINLSFYKKQKNHYTLKVQDNGEGLKRDISEKSHLSLGFELISQLLKQMNGQYSFSGDKGFGIEISFPMV